MRSVGVDPTDKILEEAMRLPIEARAALAAKLIESLDSWVDEDAEAAWAVEITRRLREIDSGAVQTIPWAQVQAEIEAARRARRSD